MAPELLARIGFDVRLWLTRVAAAALLLASEHIWTRDVALLLLHTVSSHRCQLGFFHLKLAFLLHRVRNYERKRQKTPIHNKTTTRYETMNELMMMSSNISRI